MKRLSFALKDGGLKKVTEALVNASERGHPSAESIQQNFYQLINGRGLRPTIQPKQTLPKMPKATRGLSHYDQLLNEVNAE
ncbi:hypothetical protein [Geomicrobium sp. JCM 19037]|uniref:hypothetical protein n=1 Tax=Geomicrobium sp. JCM 19037 TaxID=1460634 RepID=UPI001269201B|nr:hypothetical protein [Geomicrobium sp. JCM 19037]